jgi:hypothetical protein
LEPWFFEIEPPFVLGDDESEKVKTLAALGRELVRRMVQQIALDDDMPLEAITPGFADHAIDRVRDAIHAARDSGPGHKAANDLEELAGRYMQAMRLWLMIHRAARDRAG